MTRKTILMFMRQNRLAVGRIASLFGVTRDAVYQSVGGSGSREIRLYIARSLGVLPSLLWSHNQLDSKVLDDFYYVHSFNFPLNYPSDYIGLISKIQNRFSNLAMVA